MEAHLSLQNHTGMRPTPTPEVVPGGRVLFALASSTLVGLVVVGAAVDMAGTAVAGAAAGTQDCLCQQGSSSLGVAAGEQVSLGIRQVMHCQCACRALLHPSFATQGGAHLLW